MTNLLTQNPQFSLEDGNDNMVKAVINEMISFAKDLTVTCEASYNKMTSLYSQARSWQKIIDAKRKDLAEPYRKKITLINDRAAELLDPLDTIINLAKHKSSGYMKILEKKKEEEAESIKLAASLFDDENPYIPPATTIVKGKGASTYTRLEKKFRVIDKEKIPLKYLTVDEAAIKQDLALGLADIPGIEVYEEKTTYLRAK